IERIQEEIAPPFLTVVQALAIHCQATSADILAHVLGLDRDATVERLRWLSEAGIIREVHAGFEFRMESLPVVIQSFLPRRAKRRLHKRWYEVLRLQPQ